MLSHNKPLPEPMLSQTYISSYGVNRPQWVKSCGVKFISVFGRGMERIWVELPLPFLTFLSLKTVLLLQSNSPEPRLRHHCHISSGPYDQIRAVWSRCGPQTSVVRSAILRKLKWCLSKQQWHSKGVTSCSKSSNTYARRICWGNWNRYKGELV